MVGGVIDDGRDDGEAGLGAEDGIGREQGEELGVGERGEGVDCRSDGGGKGLAGGGERVEGEDTRDLWSEIEVEGVGVECAGEEPVDDLSGMGDVLGGRHAVRGGRECGEGFGKNRGGAEEAFARKLELVDSVLGKGHEFECKVKTGRVDVRLRTLML